MASGFSGGGPEFYSGIGRSIANLNNTNNNHHPSSQPPFRTTSTPPPTNSHHHHLSQIYLDPPSQIPHQRPSPTNLTPSTLIGKRTLADFQAHHQTGLNPAALNGLLLRSVKPRMYNPQQYAPTLSSMEFPAAALSSSQRYGVPLLQQLIRHHHPINLGSAGPTLQGVPYVNQNNRGGGGSGAVESENKMMNRLQELEKQLLEDDNDEDENDAVSVITTAHSEWSDTIHNLIVAPNSSSSNPISPSPTSSSTSTSASPPVSNCSRQTLLDAAAAISEGKNDVAAEILTRASQVSNPRGNSEQRLMEYMSMALKSRLNSAENPPPVTDMYGEEHFGSTQLLYEVSPCFKLGFVAANLAILEATLGQKPAGVNGFHVIDFDVGHGGQYADLLHALAERGKPAAIKITAVADNGAEEKDRLKVIRDKLSQFAGRLVGVSLSFNIVSCKVGDLTRESLGCEPDEPLAVNFAFKLFRMADESVSMENPRDELLRRVKGLAPRVVTLVEQELNTNTAPFMARVRESCAYYAALFDSIESTGPSDSGERVKVETGLGRKLANSVACEGRDRTERCEVFGKWRARFSMAGFELKPLSENVSELVKSRLSSVNSRFTVKEDNGGVCLGWMGKTLTVASAWR